MEKLLEQIHKNASTFGIYNKNRLRFLRDQLPQNKKDVFDLIPVILHEEEITLPGQDAFSLAPSGISNFSYNSSLSSLVKSYFPHFSPKRQAKSVLPFHFLSVMGSAGTLAFSGASDIDFWIGMDTSKTDPHMLISLKKKIEAIEKWAYNSCKLEIHLFITDINKLNNNDFGDLEGESCGSALAKLLKDEFYRTAIFVAGKLPFYWICPAGANEQEYNSLLNTLSQTKNFPIENYENIGHVWNISRSEYFGACLWHILKGLHSPFKSVLKIAILDKYTSQDEETPPLCDTYKKMVFQAENSSSFPDPYVFMANATVKYFTDNGNERHRKLVEQCFLIHNLMHLNPNQKDYAKRVEIFLIIANKWGWYSDQIKDASSFKLWDTLRQNSFRNSVLNFFADTYKQIRKKTHQFDISISQKDMTVIGKKFMAFFISKRNKIPFEMPLLSCSYYLGYILEKKIDTQKQMKFVLYAVVEGETQNIPKQVSISHSPVILIVSLIQNAIYNNKIPIKIFEDAAFSSDDVTDLLETLKLFFKSDKYNPLTPEEILEESHIQSMLVIPNWNIDPTTEITTIDVIYQNNIGEFFHDAYTGETTLSTLGAMLKKFLPKKIKSIRWAVFVNKTVMTHKSKLGYKLKKHLKDITS